MRAALSLRLCSALLGLGFLVLAVVSCREEAVRHRAPAGPPPAALRAQLDLREPAKRVMAAALTLLERCELRDEPDGCRPLLALGRAEAAAAAPFIHDECRPEPKELAALAAAVTALAEAGRQAQAQGAMASFVVQTELFVDWLQLLRETGPVSGTALHFQWLAAAYNHTSPAAPLPVDPPRLLAAYREGPQSPTAPAAKRHEAVFGRRREAGALLGWRRCGDGPCLPCW